MRNIYIYSHGLKRTIRKTKIQIRPNDVKENIKLRN